jgi:3-oxoacyl-[acyl-carrier protein] reductase
MDLGLKGKTALVTGGSEGIGRAIAERLAGEGARVAVVARERKALDAVVKGIRTEDGEALGIAADITNPTEAERILRETVRAFGSVDVLVNNAGTIGSTKGFLEVTDGEWRAVFDLNLFALVHLTRLVVVQMQRQRWGRIINIASESGIQPDAFMPHYNASKAAVLNLTKSLSKQLADDGILVNAVSPALIKTPLVEEMFAHEATKRGLDVESMEARFLAENRPNIVLHRTGTPAEVAAVVAFLSSEAASFVTGSNYRVDGGSVASL